MNRAVLFLIASFLVLQGCATESDLRKQGVVAMSAAEIKEKLVGNSLVGTSSGGHSVTWFIRQEGTVSGINANSGRGDSGTWKISQDDALCTQWSRWGSECSKVYFMENKIRLCSSSGSCGKFEIVQGNPENL